MGHTRRDWSTYGKLETVFALFDLGELAARLGSIDTFERGGNVIFMDGFEDGLRGWYFITLGVGSSVLCDCTRLRSGAYSVRLTTGDTVGDLAAMRHEQAYPNPGKLGFELSFQWLAGIQYLYVRLDVYTGAVRYQAELRCDLVDSILAYLNAAGSWTNFAVGISLQPSSFLFHTLKLVGDFQTGKYMRCLLDATIYPLVGILCLSTSDTTSPFCRVELRAESQVAGNQLVRIDDVIITRNED